MTEGGIKQFNKRVKSTEPFWHNHGVEPIPALRVLWQSNDDRRHQHWAATQPSKQAA